MFQKMIIKKAKKAVQDFMEELDLDKDGRSDIEEQIMPLVDRLGKAIVQLGGAVNQAQVAAVATEMLGLLEAAQKLLVELQDAIDKQEATEAMVEMKAVAGELGVFVKGAIEALKAK